MSDKPRLSRRLLHHLLVLDRCTYTLQTETIPLFCRGLPEAFRGARIALVADVHLPDALLPLPALVKAVEELRPDVIFVLGDLTNSYTRFDADGLRELARSLVAIAPCYAIPGNHEWRLEREPLYRDILTAEGITYLCDSFATWQRGESCLRLYGHGRQAPAPFKGTEPVLVLAHKPNYMGDFCRAGWETVFCGHAHGGQVRWGSWALFAPDQGFFPRYTGGVYTRGDTCMVVSRGLGNSSIPWRLGNQPHLPLIVLEPAE